MTEICFQKTLISEDQEVTHVRQEMNVCVVELMEIFLTCVVLEETFAL